MSFAPLAIVAMGIGFGPLVVATMGFMAETAVSPAPTFGGSARLRTMRRAPFVVQMPPWTPARQPVDEVEALFLLGMI